VCGKGKRIYRKIDDEFVRSLKEVLNK
jgi:hypothetical protein